MTNGDQWATIGHPLGMFIGPNGPNGPSGPSTHLLTPFYPFYEQNRLGMKVTLPPVNNKAQISVRTDYENSFRIKASRLWNMLPKHVNTADSLDAFKRVLGYYLKKITDTPPVPGYTAANRNSLLDWKNEMGGRT